MASSPFLIVLLVNVLHRFNNRFFSSLLIFRLMDFFPAKKQTEEYLRSVFIEKGLAEVVKLHKAQASYENKRELQQVSEVKPIHLRVIYGALEGSHSEMHNASSVLKLNKTLC